MNFTEDDLEPKVSTTVTSTSWLGTDRDYTYDEVISIYLFLDLNYIDKF